MAALYDSVYLEPEENLWRIVTAMGSTMITMPPSTLAVYTIPQKKEQQGTLRSQLKHRHPMMDTMRGAMKTRDHSRPAMIQRTGVGAVGISNHHHETSIMITKVYVVTVYVPRDYHPDEIKDMKAFVSHENAIAYVNSIGFISDGHPTYPAYSRLDDFETHVAIDELTLE